MNKGLEGAKVVIIDDDEAARLSLGQMLRLRRMEVEVFSSAESALAWPGLPQADGIITDVKMPIMDGEEFLTEIMRWGAPPPVIMITGHGDIAMAVRCLKAGAYSFVEKPFDDEVLLATVARAVEQSRLRKESEALRRRLALLPGEEEGRLGMVGRSPSMQDLYAQIEVVARSDAPVLIVGETGAGKELVARAVHGESKRSQAPFVPVNAGALPEAMLESELFGHAKGAFTGADMDRDGKLLTASGGTLLLDEVESLSERAQVQLLRVLEDGLIHPLGQDKPKRVDVRLVTTTKTDLNDLVRRGGMRKDFFHRIVVLTLHVPTLRERIQDIPLLISHFLKQVSQRNEVPIPVIPDSVLGHIMRSPWHGNVRELKNVVERLALTAQNGVVGPFAPDEDFENPRLLSLPATPGPLRDELERTERTAIEACLRECRGEINATSLALGISRRALYERMKKYELMKEEYR